MASANSSCTEKYYPDFWCCTEAIRTSCWSYSLLPVLPVLLPVIVCLLCCFTLWGWKTCYSFVKKEDKGKTKNYYLLKVPKFNFEHMFAEIEFRALRAYVMNYKLSGEYDKYKHYLDWAAFTLGIFSILLICFASLYSSSNSDWRDWFPALASAIGSGITYYTSRGGESAVLWQSFGARAQKHVDAGAEWSRLHRQAKLYRQRIQQSPDDINKEDLQKVYFELLDKYREASKCTVIDETIYIKYNVAKLVFEKDEMMRKQLQDYKSYIDRGEVFSSRSRRRHSDNSTRKDDQSKL